MALMAYDPQRVERLRRALIEAADDLRNVTCADPAAADAMRVARAAVAQMEATWLPFVTRLLASDPLSGARRGAAHISSLDESLVRVMAEGYGWSVQLDPLADNESVVSVESARALGAALNHVDPQELAVDPEQLAWLAKQLTLIGRDAMTSAEFLANFHNWDVLPLTLANQRANSYGNDYRGAALVDDIDPVIDGLLSIWRTALPVTALHAGIDASITDLLPPMRDPDPYVQALMLRSLHLDPIALATVTNDLLRAWLDDKSTFGNSLDLSVTIGPNTADILLLGIAASTTASTYFLSLIGDRPALLFQTLDDPEIGYRLALAGTDPAHTTSGAAGRAVLATLDYFRVDPYATDLATDGYAGDYGPFLARLVAPWLLRFTSANEEWTHDVALKVGLLAVALKDEQALQVLVAQGERIAEGFAHGLGAAGSDDEVLDMSLQVGGLMSLLGQLVVNERIHDESERTHFMWDLAWTILTAATNFVPGGVVANVAAGSLVTVLQAELSDAFATNDVEGARGDSELAMDVALTATAAFTLTSLFRSWVLDGRINDDATPPPSFKTMRGECSSPTYRNDVHRWADGLPRELRLTAQQLVDNFIGNGQAQEHCVELSSTGGTLGT